MTIRAHHRTSNFRTNALVKEQNRQKKNAAFFFWTHINLCLLRAFTPNVKIKKTPRMRLDAQKCVKIRGCAQALDTPWVILCSCQCGPELSHVSGNIAHMVSSLLGQCKIHMCKNPRLHPGTWHSLSHPMFMPVWSRVEHAVTVCGHLTLHTTQWD